MSRASDGSLTLFFVCVGCAFFTGCARKDAPGEIIQARPLVRYHRIVEGETLGNIAKNYGMSVDELCRLNNFTPPVLLIPGQKITIIPVTNGNSLGQRKSDIVVETAPVQDFEPIKNEDNSETLEGESGSHGPGFLWENEERRPQKRFIWPVQGNLLRRFKDRLPNGTLSDGINISAPINTPVKAVASGTIIDVGELVLGFGKMILLLHNDGMVSIYSHLQEIHIRKDEHVRQGQTIGRVGKTGNVRIPQLHFQLRNSMKRPINPLDYLDK